MPVVAYVDPDSAHNPASGTAAPASWFTTLEADFRSIEGRVGARIYNDTAEDFAIPGPTTLSLPDTDWNNGMTVGSNAITVPSSTYAGKYLIIGNVRVTTAVGAANSTWLSVAINGTDVHTDVAARAAASGSLEVLSISFTYALVASDAITLRSTQTGSVSDADTDISAAYPSLTAIWLSA